MAGVPFRAAEMETKIWRCSNTDTGVAHTREDYETDQEVRWCPGCGDYGILAASAVPAADARCEPQQRFVFVCGIGCNSRFPYYMNVYGLHSIHGRASRSGDWRGHGPSRLVS